MTIIGAIGILAGLIAYQFSSIQKTRKHTAVFFTVFVLHVATTFFYHAWAQTNSTDATLYYYDEARFYGRGFGLNTSFVIYLVQFLKSNIGGSYLDYFLIFQATGMWAIAFMMRIMEEIYAEVSEEPPIILYAFFFFPSPHFFTVAIGKDGPLMLGVSMAIWAAMKLRSRLPAFALALLIMVCFRPHIALVATIALAASAVFYAGLRGYVRVMLALLAVVSAGFVAGTVQSTFSVDVTSATSVSDFFERQSHASQRFVEGTAVLNAPFFVRLLSLLFRPLFFDANSLLSIIASVENIFMMIFIGAMVARWKDLVELYKRVFFVRFALVFAFMLTLLLAYIYYNVGLGLRQRTMMLPALLAIYGSLLAIRRARKGLAPTLSTAPA